MKIQKKNGGGVVGGGGGGGGEGGVGLYLIKEKEKKK